MTEFDPVTFEDKYANYFPELQEAYKNAFERMNETYDSELIHAIDQTVLAESEPFYEGPDEGDRVESGSFRLDLPENPAGRVASAGVIVDEETLDAVLSEYVAALEEELRIVFGFEEAGVGGANRRAGRVRDGECDGGRESENSQSEN